MGLSLADWIRHGTPLVPNPFYFMRGKGGCPFRSVLTAPISQLRIEIGALLSQVLTPPAIPEGTALPIATEQSNFH
jgi:hypothetical protein